MVGENMIKLIFDPPQDLIEAIGNVPKLYNLHMGQNYDDSRRWYPKNDVKYYVYMDEEKGTIVGMIALSILTDKMLDVHIYILPQYWGTQISQDCASTTLGYLRDETNFNVLLTACPAQCIHAQNFIERVGFKKSAILKKAMTYAGKLQDLHQYVFNLR